MWIIIFFQTEESGEMEEADEGILSRWVSDTNENIISFRFLNSNLSLLKFKKEIQLKNNC